MGEGAVLRSVRSMSEESLLEKVTLKAERGEPWECLGRGHSRQK